MEFNEKLDFLMNVTKTSNSSLAHHLSLDASYISRLRSGKRKLPSNANYAEKMASYLVRCLDNNEINNLYKILGAREYKFEDGDSLEKILYYWLINDIDNKENDSNFIEEYLYLQLSNDSNIVGKDKCNYKCNDIFQVYYGVAGKRKAVIKFLNYVIAETNPQTLYLFSEENMGWLSEDSNFLKEWASLMIEVIKRGNKIKIIHTVTRNLDEMLVAIEGWLPLYLTGAIESYYYPKKRDGIFQRTLFIAPNTIAIESTSVGNKPDDSPNILTFDNMMIQGFKKEFLNYLSLCKPLTQVFDTKTKWQYYKNIHEFENKIADSIIKSDSLSILTLPETVLESIIKRNSKVNALVDLHKSKLLNFKNNIEENIYIEILRMPKIDKIKSDQARVRIFNPIFEEDISYSIEEYKLHLENIIDLLKNFDNYHLYLCEEKNSQDYSFCIKEGVGIFIWDSSNPTVIVKIEENNMVAAFWDYIKFELHLDNINNKNTTIDKLKKIINEL